MLSDSFAQQNLRTLRSLRILRHLQEVFKPQSSPRIINEASTWNSYWIQHVSCHNVLIFLHVSHIPNGHMSSRGVVNYTTHVDQWRRQVCCIQTDALAHCLFHALVLCMCNLLIIKYQRSANYVRNFENEKSIEVLTILHAMASFRNGKFQYRSAHQYFTMHRDFCWFFWLILMAKILRSVVH